MPRLEREGAERTTAEVTMLKQGDTVAFTAAFVRNAGGFDKDLADARGTVEHADVDVGGAPATRRTVGAPTFVLVSWAQGPWAGEQKVVSASALCVPGSARFGDAHTT